MAPGRFHSYNFDFSDRFAELFPGGTTKKACLLTKVLVVPLSAIWRRCPALPKGEMSHLKAFQADGKAVFSPDGVSDLHGCGGVPRWLVLLELPILDGGDLEAEDGRVLFLRGLCRLH